MSLHIAGRVQSRVVAGQPSPPSPLSLNGRGGAERILMKKLPSPREGEGAGSDFAHALLFYNS